MTKSGLLPSQVGARLVVAVSSIVFLTFGFAAVGWWTSDARKLATLSHENKLNSPERAFTYITQHWKQASADNPLPDGRGIQAMLARPSQRLWCDEGAIVLSLLIQRLGYPTRLVDLFDANRPGYSGHTTMQVQQGGKWITYDFSSRRYDIPLTDTIPYQAIPKYRKYPNSPLHWILLYNGILRILVASYRN